MFEDKVSSYLSASQIVHNFDAFVVIYFTSLGDNSFDVSKNILPVLDLLYGKGHFLIPISITEAWVE